ncbi:hypothetical protein Mag101_00335 [Microbulbifer agarilyticus]|uniref:Secreted protein n=1 Tax=Microbulbifer agarilyticus TaxID=260552 RepID=A0A1Q2M156_9GAMM|nr:hypothetical protein [Microbulbifer agarilyticus]AQQ66268.1 hypothetical protein Mag101_00335 [Microbulbifer agarilyticus]
MQQRFIHKLLVTSKQTLISVGVILLSSTGTVWAQDSASDSSSAPGPSKEQQPKESQQSNKREQAGQYPGWEVESRLQAEQWVGNWLISRDGEAQHVWSLNKDGTGRSYAFNRHGDEMKFAYGYDISWYFDPHTQMANIKTERRIVCRGGRIYPYFLTLKSYESDYAVKGKFAWQTTWTEASIGRNYLHKSLVVFVAPLSAWHNPEKNAPCPIFPRMDVEKDIDLALDRWEQEAQQSEHEQLVDTTPVEGEPEFTGEDFGPAVAEPKGEVPGQKASSKSKSAKARVKDKSRRDRR